eukprot:c16136_g2_i1 orf=307-852(+)
MHFSSFLSGQREQAAKVQEDGVVPDGEGDRTLLLCKTPENGIEDQLTNHGKTNSRLKTWASPWRSATGPIDGTMSLLIHRMDGTTFVVEVPKKASLQDLKEAIQKKFQTGGYQVSWPHVWGHFCLSFRDQKLLEEHLALYKLGIGESDELVFVRHLDTRPSKDYQQRGFFTSLRRKHRKTI